MVARALHCFLDTLHWYDECLPLLSHTEALETFCKKHIATCSISGLVALRSTKRFGVQLKAPKIIAVCSTSRVMSNHLHKLFPTLRVL